MGSSAEARGSAVLRDSKTQETFAFLRQMVPGVPGIRGDGVSPVVSEFRAEVGAEESQVFGVPIMHVRPRCEMEKHRDHSSSLLDYGYRGSVFAVLDSGRVFLAVKKRMRCAVCGRCLECNGEDIREAFRGT